MTDHIKIGDIQPWDRVEQTVVGVRSLEFRDKLALADVAKAQKYLGQAFDVTEAYVLRNVKE